MTPHHVARPIAMLVATALLLGTSGCKEPEPTPELPPRAIRWMRVSTEVPAEARVISGIVTAIDDTRLAFEVGGTVVDVQVNLGDTVERDQMLAKLDPEPFELAVRDAEAALAKAVARSQAADANYARTKALFEADVASVQELDRETATRDSRSSQIDATRARLNLAKRDLRRSVLRSPFKGSISVRSIDPAMKVASGQTAFEMDSEESGLRVEVQMPETMITRIVQGSEVDVTFPSIEATGTQADRVVAVVSEVGTRAGAGNSFPVRADLVERLPELRPGMTAELHFQLPPTAIDDLGIDGFVVPFAAVKPEMDKTFSVYVYDEASSSVKRKTVKTGGVRDNDVAVLSGLADGDIIAIAGVSFLFDGQPVTLAVIGKETEL